MARAVHALHSLLCSRNSRIAASAHELDAAISVWADLPLGSSRTRKASTQIAVLEERLATLQRAEARIRGALSLGAVGLAAISVALIVVIALVHVPGGAAPAEVHAVATL